MATAVTTTTEIATRDLGPLSLRAEFVPSTIDLARRTVQVVWTTGAAVLRAGMFTEPYYEELSLDPAHVRMGRLQSGAAPLLDSHNADGIRSVIGVVENAQLGKRNGTATVRFDSGVEGADAFRKVQEGILRNVSVGYRTYKMDKVSGGDAAVPTFRAIDWEPAELSMVPIGADAGAATRAAAPEVNPCVFVTRQQEKITMADEDKPTTVQPGESPAVAATRAATNAKIEDAKARAAALAQEREAAIAEERVRSAEIRKIGLQSGLGEDWALKLIEAGSTVDEARTVAFNAMTKRDGEFEIDGSLRVGAGEDERDKRIRGMSAWLFHRTGTKKMLEQAKKADPELFKGLDLDDGGEFRGMTPVDLARECLERQGVKTRGMDRMRLVGEAFTRSTNYQATGDFPILLENVLGKVLLGAYATQDNTWMRFCKTDEVPDFRTSNRYRTGSLPGLDVLAEHSEYKTGIIPDGSKYPIATQRMGKMFGLSRETIVNDDMSALVDMATKLGAAAMRSIETAVYALIAQNTGLGPTQGDSQPFFHANRSNVATQAALTMAALDADRVIMRAQKDPNGQDFLDLSPAVLLVPDALRGLAMQLNDSQYDIASNKLQNPNIVRGLFRDVIGTPRLTGTRRYLIADPLDWIVVAFLEGYGRGPVMESQQGWRIDGVEWKVTLYAKPQMGDPKVAVTNAG